jgi:LmbE family N-acetylglucosaminyl deacetylase
MSAQAVRMNRESDRNEEQPTNGAEPQPDHEQVATLAYRLWHERGCPEGSPEVDWFQAQQQLLRNGQPQIAAPVLTELSAGSHLTLRES